MNLGSFSRLLMLGMVMALFSACNISLPSPIPASTQINGSLQKWTGGARVLKADVTLGGSGMFATLATTNLTVEGTFQITLPNTVQTNQGLYGFSNVTCLQSTPNLGVQDFFSLASFHGVGKSTGIVGLASSKGLHGWMYATQDGSVSGNCNVTGGSITFALNLKAGWNQVLLEAPNNTTIKYSTAAIPSEASWGYATRANNGNIIASPVSTFKIGETVQLKALDQNENEIANVVWATPSSDVASVSANGVVTAKRLGSFVVTATKAPNIYIDTDRVFTYGLQFGAGTLNDESGNLKTAFIAKYLNENLQPTKTDLNLSITGPSGWNNGTPLQMTIPAGELWAEKFSDAAPINGTYTAQSNNHTAGSNTSQVAPTALTLQQRYQAVLKPSNSSLEVRPSLRTQANVFLTSTSVLNTNKAITTPNFKWNNLSTSGFTATYGLSSLQTAGSHLLELREQSTNVLVSKKVASPQNSSSVDFSGLNLDNSKTYRLDATSRTVGYNYDDVDRKNPFWTDEYHVYKGSRPVVFTPVIQSLSANGALQSGGVKLVLEGANFSGDSSVKFGLVNATSVSFVNEAKLEVIVPAAAQVGAVDVVVSNSKGQSTPDVLSRFEYLKINEFTPSSQGSVGRLEPDNIGRVWFSGSDNGAYIGFMTNTGTVTKFTLPSGLYTVSDMDFGAGAMWFTSYNNLVKVTDTGTFTTYPLPGNSYDSYDVAFGYDGAVWVSSQNKSTVARYDTSGNLLNELTATVNVRGLVKGPDQSMWFIGANNFGSAGQIGKINAAQEIRVFTPTGTEGGTISSIMGLIPTTNNGIFFRAIYATNSMLGQIQADTSSSVFDNNLAIGSIIFGQDNNFWYTRQNLGAFSNEPLIVRYSLTREQKAYLVAIRTNTNQFSFEDINQIASTNGFIWFTRANVNKIGIIQLNP